MMMSVASRPADRVVLGRIAGVFGVQGWVKIESHTRPREAIFDYRPWQLEQADGWHDHNMLAGRSQGSGLVAQLEGITDREKARALIDASIAVAREQLPMPADNEVYWADLEGCAVINRAGTNLGTVSHLIETGANDVLVVENDRQRLIPYIRDVIDTVDIGAHTIRVDWDEDF